MGELSGFSERAKGVAIFQPLLELKNLRKYEDFDLFSLGFSILLFIMESMLYNRERCGYPELSAFLREQVSIIYRKILSEEESLELARFLMDHLRNNGSPWCFEYLDLEDGKTKKYRFHLIGLADYDHGSHGGRDLHFKLTDEGLDLIFKTKEIYKELRISISQLYFRQQIERGVFDKALETVRELYTQVRSRMDEMEKFRRRMVMNIGGVLTEDYQKQVKEIYNQLEREQEVFQALSELVKEKKEAYLYERLEEIEEKNLDQLIEISNMLDIVINEHSKLFGIKLRTDEQFRKALVESIKNFIQSKIDFRKEVLEKVIASETRGDDLRKFLQPLLTPARFLSFNPMRIFIPQKLQREREGFKEEELPLDQSFEMELERELKRKKERDRRFREYIEVIFEPLRSKNDYTLKEVLEGLPQQKREEFSNRAEFYSFLVGLHQLSPVELRVDPEIRGKIFDSEDNLPFLLLEYFENQKLDSEKRFLEVQATCEELSFENGCVVTNYCFHVIEGDELNVR
ncbi:MAG: hypothetical protein J7K79_03710 [Thermotoga sp.]|nr:hypothetical protein [Thermotoga sp.]